METSFGRKGCVRRDEITFKRVSADKLYLKALSASVATDKKAHSAAALVDLLKVREQCGYLVLPSDSDIRRARSWNDSCGHRGQK